MLSIFLSMKYQFVTILKNAHFSFNGCKIFSIFFFNKGSHQERVTQCKGIIFFIIS